MNAARRLWASLTAASDLRPDRRPCRGRDAESPQMFLERVQREHRHSWHPTLLLSGRGWQCASCGFEVAATSEMTVTRP